MNEILGLAKEAAVRAGECAANLLGKVSAEQKSTTYDLVTAADRQSEEIMVNFLRREMPEAAILSEETLNETDRCSDRLWIIDPLDGTTNFAHGIPHYGICAAYAEKGTILAGVVFDPSRKEIFSAFTGKGAFRNDEPIRVSQNGRLEQSLIATGFYYDRGALMEKTLSSLHRLFKRDIHCMRRMGSAALDLTWLACGRHDGYFEYTLSPWDFAAGLIILREAGGTAEGIDGKPADLFSKGLVCSNGLIHDELKAIVL